MLIIELSGTAVESKLRIKIILSLVVKQFRLLLVVLLDPCYNKQWLSYVNRINFLTKSIEKNLKLK
jgi:hypothetical protein